MKEKTRVRRALIIGANPAGIAAATKLGEIGIPVTLVEEAPDLHETLGEERFAWPSGQPSNFALRPGLLRLMRNPLVEVRTATELRSIKRMPQGFRATLLRNPTYIDPERCIQCGRCVEVCPVELDNGDKPIHGSSRWSLPGAYTIDKRRAALCSEGCPLGVNVQGYMALTAAGKYREALDLIRQDNVLPGVCGRVCTHPCELQCRRAEVDSPLNIREIKRFLADSETARGDAPRIAANPGKSRDEKVGIIGSGPAGLAAAADLARLGYGVTVLEKMAEAGGLLRYGIGPYRLPREVLAAEIAAICDLGVKIVTGRQVSLPEDLPALKKDFDAVLAATGCWQDHVLGVEGEDLSGVWGCIDLLGKIYSGDAPELSKKVAVIGDGNSAMDLARALTRLGCDVTILSWFPEDLIPAAKDELADALEEGVRLVDSAQVVAFEGKDGRLRAIRLAPTRPGPPDKNGIPWPVIIEGAEEFTLDFECAVVAIGQKYVDLGLEGTGVFTAGDAASGPSSVVDAMRSGRDAAGAIHEALSGEACSFGEDCSRPDLDYNEIPENLAREERVCAVCLGVFDRTQDFREVALGLSEEEAREEARRCLMCGVCSDCLECVDACGEINAIRHDDVSTEDTVQAGVVILTDPRWASLARGADVMRAYPRRGQDPNVLASTVRGFAAAGQVMNLLGIDDLRRPLMDFGWSPPEADLAPEVRIGMFVCRCNDSMGWDESIDAMVEGYDARPGVEHTEVINSMCNAEVVEGIIKTIHQKRLTRVVLASCVCCPLNLICGTCTDRRSLLKSLLFTGTGVNRAMFETCNLRGEALSWFRVDRVRAIQKTEGLLERSLLRARRLISMSPPHRLFNFTTVVIGDSEAARTSAQVLAATGLAVYHIGGPGEPLSVPAPDQDGIQAWPGSRLMSVLGQLGNFTVLFEFEGETREVRAGVVVYGENEKQHPLPYSPSEDQPFRKVETGPQKPDVPGVPFIMPGATSIAGLFLVEPPLLRISNTTKGYAAAALASCVSRRQARQYKGYTVVINEQLCRHCGRCVQACPYQAVTFQPNALGMWKAVVDEALCKGCGNCISNCPTGAADSPYRNQRHLENMLAEILVVKNDGQPR